MSYPKIPTPPAQYWRELRVTALPLAVFLVTMLVVVKLWSERAATANLTGVVVGSRAEIRSPLAGVLMKLQVRRFQYVNAGDLIAEVVTTDIALLEAQLAVAAAELELVQRGMGPMENLQRNLMNRVSLEADVVKQRVELASAAIAEQRLRREYERARQLFAERIITEEEHDRIRSELEVVTVQIEEGTRLLEELLPRLEELRRQFEAPRRPEDPVAAAVRFYEEKLRLIEAEATPFRLVAPISGMVSELFRENGEAVVDGEAILVIRSERPEYVVGYLPHPLRMDPQEGMPVVIRTQGSRQRQYEGQIVKVGAQLEDMTEAQNLVTDLIRMALPIQIAVTDDFSLRPGEIVNLTIAGVGRRGTAAEPGGDR
jgi:multidrug resistance efflux pump